MAVRWYASVGVLTAALYFVVSDPVVYEIIYVVVGASAVVATIGAVRVWTPPHSTAWLVLAAGAALWVLGDLIGFLDTSNTFPSHADAIYLIGYPVFGFGLLMLRQRGWRHGELGHVVNATIIMVAFALVGWVFFLDPAETDSSTLAEIISVAYPAMDVFLLALLVHSVIARSTRTPSYRLLTASVGMLVVADSISNFATRLITPDARSFVDIGWMASYLLLGAAALHPSMRIPHRERTLEWSEQHLVASFDSRTIAVLTCATFTAPAVMAVEVIRGAPVAQWGWAIVFSATTLVSLVFIRIAELIRLLHAQSEALRVTADTDHSTGLSNRRVLDRWLRTRADSGEITLLVLGVDRFKDINDTFGHGFGDEVLRVIAGRLSRLVGDRGLVVRIGGDEFAVAVDAATSNVDTLAAEMHLRIGEPVKVRSVRLYVEASIGIVTGMITHSSESLVQHAALAMQSAKSAAPRTEKYDRTMDRDARDKLLLVGALNRAIEQRQLEMYYQPQLDLRTSTVTGVEALIRWNHPDEGVLGPDRFMPMAERTGLIRSLSAYVLDHSLAQRQAWQAAGLDLAVGVNLSTRNLLDDSVVDQVGAALSRYATPAEMLTLEITETSAMTDPAHAIRTMVALRALGVVLAIDDYGTGYSSLSYLRQLPVQQLKIDKTFVTELGNEYADAAIVKSTIDLARTLGLSVIAEGVENGRTLSILRSLECDLAQGYYLGRPVRGEQVPDLVADIERRLRDREGEQSNV